MWKNCEQWTCRLDCGKIGTDETGVHDGGAVLREEERQMKLVVLDGFLANHDRMDWGLMRDHRVVWYDESQPHEIAQRIGDAQGVITNRAPVTAETIRSCPNLEYIGTLGTGYNMIDLTAAREAGITVCNAPDYSSFAVAQATFALLLELVNRTSVFHRYVSSGGWTSPLDRNITDVPMIELYGKTIGLIGCGSIGRQVARQATSFGMEVLAVRRHPGYAEGDGGPQFVPLEQLLAQSDIVSIHCPLNDETRGLLNRERIAQMKDGAILINTARGAILDAQAVAQALDSGKLYLAGMDVLSEEPPQRDNPLVGHPRCVITPHVAWGARETRRRLLDLVEENVRRYLAGNPQNVVIEGTGGRCEDGKETAGDRDPAEEK